MRRLALVLTGTTAAMFSLPLVLPVPRMEDGLTFCYPFVGAVQRFDPDLNQAALARARAHEDAHAAQCQREGAVWHFLRGVAPSHRLTAEAEAYCAEAEHAVSNGGTARLEYARIQDELRERAWFRRYSSSALESALATQCPSIAATATRESADWEKRLHRSEATAAK